MPKKAKPVSKKAIEAKPVEITQLNEEAVLENHGFKGAGHDTDLSIEEKTKKALAKEPKVMFYIPKRDGEPADAWESVSINFVRFQIRKGVQVELPQSVATLLMEHLRIEQNGSELAQKMKLDRDEVKEGSSVRQAFS